MACGVWRVEWLLPVVHVNLHPASLESRVQVLPQRLHRQDVGASLPRRLDHELRVEHGLLPNLLPRVLQLLVHPAPICREGRQR